MPPRRGTAIATGALQGINRTVKNMLTVSAARQKLGNDEEAFALDKKQQSLNIKKLEFQTDPVTVAAAKEKDRLSNEIREADFTLKKAKVAEAEEEVKRDAILGILAGTKGIDEQDAGLNRQIRGLVGDVDLGTDEGQQIASTALRGSLGITQQEAARELFDIDKPKGVKGTSFFAKRPDASDIVKRYANAIKNERDVAAFLTNKEALQKSLGFEDTKLLIDYIEEEVIPTLSQDQLDSLIEARVLEEQE